MISEDRAIRILMDDLNVSRETIQDLEILTNLLKKWTKAINLVGKATIDSIWSRHILDSAQLWRLRPDKLDTWVDLGSGGGFPALVLAILAKSDNPSVVFHLIESDERKCAFLKNVSRETLINTHVSNVRVENSKQVKADVVSARALAPVDKLLGLSHGFLTENAFCLFLKGQSCATEVEKAHESWNFCSKIMQSTSNDGGAVLKVWDIQRINAGNYD